MYEFSSLGYSSVYATVKAFKKLMTNCEISSLNLQLLVRQDHHKTNRMYKMPRLVIQHCPGFRWNLTCSLLRYMHVQNLIPNFVTVQQDRLMLRISLGYINRANNFWNSPSLWKYYFPPFLPQKKQTNRQTNSTAFLTVSNTTLANPVQLSRVPRTHTHAMNNKTHL